MVTSLKFVIDAHRKRENKSSDAMDLDLSEPWIPPLETLLSACLSYDFSPVAVRLSIRKYLSDARDLVAILGVLEGWLHGVKSVAVNTENRTTVVPPYPKKNLSADRTGDRSLRSLRTVTLGYLEPFAKAHVRTLREKAGCVPKESPTELKRQRKRMEQQASLGVGGLCFHDGWHGLSHTPLAVLITPAGRNDRKNIGRERYREVRKPYGRTWMPFLSNGVLDHALDLIKGGKRQGRSCRLGIRSYSHRRTRSTPVAITTTLDVSRLNLELHYRMIPPFLPRVVLRVSPYPMINLKDALDIIMTEIQSLEVVTLPVTAGLDGPCSGGRMFVRRKISLRPRRPMWMGTQFAPLILLAYITVLTSRTHKLSEELPEGSIFRINTGGPLPAASDSVIMVEDTELESTLEDADGEDAEEGSKLKLLRRIGRAQGDLVMEMGEVITSAGGEVGTLAFVGRKEVGQGGSKTGCRSPYRLNLCLETDGEGYGTPNRPSLQAALEGMGYKVIDLGIVADRGLETADILLTTGGTSMGTSDLLKPVIERRFNGTIHFGRVAIKPGKPTTLRMRCRLTPVWSSTESSVRSTPEGLPRDHHGWPEVEPGDEFVRCQWTSTATSTGCGWPKQAGSWRICASHYDRRNSDIAWREGKEELFSWLVRVRDNTVNDARWMYRPLTSTRARQ
ncbi:hypothetical protein BKA82DRAFT_4012880 [Pisolithus tinctorius]|nr:hypothetical protein BKA82DRAFT_4012880 [Pisolithus tinctorius]